MPNNQPKVSVCLPTYNGGNKNFLVTAINSILDQSFDDFELIIIDDYSTDQTPAIIQSYLENLGGDRRIKYYQNDHNLGLFPNWNKCLSLATGEYITILGQDDLMQPDNLLKKVRILDEYSQVGLVTSSVKIIDDHNQITTWEWANYPNSYLINGQEWLLDTVGEANPICCPAVMFRKSILEKIGKQFDTNYDYTADLKMWVEIAKVSDLYFLADFLINYRWHERNTTHSFTALKQVSENLQVWSEFLDNLVLSNHQFFDNQFFDDQLSDNSLHQATKSQNINHINNIENIAITRAIQWVTVNKIYPLLEGDNLQHILELYNYLSIWRNKPLDINIFFQALINGMQSILATKSRLELEVKNYVNWVNEQEQKFLDAQAEIKRIMTWAEGLDNERLELIENVKRLQDEKIWLESQVKVWMETAQKYYNQTQFNKTH